MDNKKNRAVVRVPGTSANCGPGFDCLGLATTIYNYLDLTLLHVNKIVVEASGEGAENIPRGKRNLTWQAVQRLLQEVGRETDFKGAIIRTRNNVPISRGLGSSSTAIVGGLVAANEILGAPLTRQELLKLATELEGHPDNVAPALFGGFTVSVMDKGAVQTFSFQPRIKLKLIVAVAEKYFDEGRDIQRQPRVDVNRGVGRGARRFIAACLRRRTSSAVQKKIGAGHD